jgi:FdrA protein
VAALGEGISHGIGVGGRDLSAEVGGAMTILALEALARDVSTEAIVIVSKPAAPVVIPTLEAGIRAIAKPVIVCCLGAAADASAPGTWASTLEAAAEAAVAAVRGRAWTARAFSDPAGVRARLASTTARGTLLGLYTGGTLAHEARLLMEPLLGPIDTTITGDAGRHRIVDLGADEFTHGRPHPMIDAAARDARVREAGRSADVGVLLLDVVLGRAAHPDPARSLSAAIRDARAAAQRAGRSIVTVVSVTGTKDDPQGLDGRSPRSRRPGPCAAVKRAGGALRGPRPEAGSGSGAAGGLAMSVDTVLGQPLRVINLGLEVFAREVEAEGATVVHVDWRPPAGSASVAALLARLDDDDAS